MVYGGNQDHENSTLDNAIAILEFLKAVRAILAGQTRTTSGSNASSQTIFCVFSGLMKNNEN